jgi:hypothetical protein
MFRFIIKELQEWLADEARKPLVIRGARQTGKTWVAREIAKIEDKQLNLAVRFNPSTPSKASVDTKLTTGESVQYQLLSLPFYLIGQLNRLLEKLI